MSTRHPLARLLVGLTGVAVALFLTAAPAHAKNGGSEPQAAIWAQEHLPAAES
jgi:hypothetical protein